MALMAFRVGGLGLPLGLAWGGLTLGFKSGSTTKIFRVLSSGETGLGINLQTSRPFTIDDDSRLLRLFDERIYFELNGSGMGSGDVEIEFKVFDSGGAPVYTTERLAPIKGDSIGGWKISGERLQMIYPSDVVGPPDATYKEGQIGEQLGVSLGLLSPSFGHLSREPEGIWEVIADDGWTYYYRFNQSGVVQWFYDLYNAKQRYWHFEDGKGRWDIKRNSKMEIDWVSGDKEVWPVPFLQSVNGNWTTPDGEFHRMAAKRLD